MKIIKLASIGVSLLLFTTSAFADVVISEQSNNNYLKKGRLEKLATKLHTTEEKLKPCLQEVSATTAPHKNTSLLLKQCLTKLDKQAQENIEHINVIGHYVGLEVPEIEGRFHLDRNFIAQAPQTSGDINDLISLLPGIQSSEDELSVENAGEIRAKELSISGANPWQTGFFIEGMNFNSQQDPGAYDRSISSINDIQGAPQAFSVNSQIVNSIDVYDNNIPAEYGGFSGGVVSVKTRSAFDAGIESFSLGYRGSRSDWGSFHVIQAKDEDNDSPFDDDEEIAPIYEKNSINLLASLQLNEHHGVMLSANYLESDISKLSLQENVVTSRRNTNILFKYSLRDLGLDYLDWSVIYAPYENNNLLTNILDSDLTIQGGGLATTLNIKQQIGEGEWHSTLSINESKNSKKAPEHYYIWNQLKGKEWGQLTDQDDDDGDGDLVSLQGGYGDLDKKQRSYSWVNKFQFDSILWKNSLHDVMLGFELNRNELSRYRPNDSYYYNSALQYSTELGSTPFNCSGYQNDCIELSYVKPLAELEAELGEPLDFSNAEHIIAYSENILTAPQYFQARIVRSAEDIKVDVNKLSMFIEDHIEWDENLSLNLGLRYDYDDFFKNHNIAPRLSGGYQLNDDKTSLLTFGVNRYYDTAITTYKLKELQTPYYVEYRNIRNSYLQGWNLSSSDSDLRYKYNGLKTSYNDEATIGWKISTEWLGSFSIKYVKRWQQDQIARNSESYLAEDGYRYASQNNLGKGQSDRISLAWSAQIDTHSFWANTSYSEKHNNYTSYAENIDDVTIDELVWYDGKVSTKSKLTRLNADFARPVIANLGWSTQWLDSLTSTITAKYTQGYSTAISTNNYIITKQITSLCAECESTYLFLPIYKKVDLDERVMVNLALDWQVNVAKLGKLKWRVDVSNLFNSRTHLITPGDSGIETGRKFWLGVQYLY
ncbi:MAG: TonB-dependent receptor [Colwellia sp.]